MQTVRRILRFIKVYLFQNPRFFFTYALHYFDPGYTHEARFYTAEEMAELIAKRKSLIRIGDGEVYLMNRGSITFQEYDPAIREAFFRMIREYSSSSPYILGFNKIPLESTNARMRKANLLHSWLPLKVYYDLYFKKDERYVDASLFYYNETIPKYFEAFLKTQHIVLVTNAENIKRFKDNHRIPFSDVTYIETPTVHAYREAGKIQSAVLKEVERYSKDKTVVVMACGPAGKVVGFTLAEKGVLVFDLGHGIEVAYSDTKLDYIANPFLVRG